MKNFKTKEFLKITLAIKINTHTPSTNSRFAGFQIRINIMSKIWKDNLGKNTSKGTSAQKILMIALQQKLEIGKYWTGYIYLIFIHRETRQPLRAELPFLMAVNSFFQNWLKLFLLFHIIMFLYKHLLLDILPCISLVWDILFP